MKYTYPTGWKGGSLQKFFCQYRKNCKIPEATYCTHCETDFTNRKRQLLWTVKGFICVNCIEAFEQFDPVFALGCGQGELMEEIFY